MQHKREINTITEKIPLTFIKYLLFFQSVKSFSWSVCLITFIYKL